MSSSESPSEWNGRPEDELTLSNEDLKCLESVATGIRLAAKIVDMPCNYMTVDDFLQACIYTKLCKIIRGTSE